MYSIHKYPVTMSDNFTVKMPRWSKILCVQVQRGIPFFWALVNTDQPIVERRFALRGTGHPAPDLLYLQIA